MKKVYLKAYCKENLGDDMFLVSLLRRYPNTSFFLRADSTYTSAIKDFSNLHIKSPQNSSRLAEQLSALIGYDAFVKLGGSIFMEPKDWKEKPPFPAWLSKLINRKKYIIGANFGPYYTEAFWKRAYSSLKYYGGVCFRDKASYALFQNIPQVKEAPDVLFGYPYPMPVRGHGVCISVIDPERKMLGTTFAEQYYAATAQIADYFLSQGKPVCLLGFCKAERDGEAIEKVLRNMQHPGQAEVYQYHGDIDGMLHRINTCEYLVAARFHAMIIGFALKKKVLPVIYSSKQINVLKDLDYQGGYWDLLHGENLTPEQATTSLSKAPILSEIEVLAVRSSEHFSQLDTIVKY